MGSNMSRAERELAKPGDNCGLQPSPLLLYLCRAGRGEMSVNRLRGAGSEHPNLINSSEGVSFLSRDYRPVL